MKSCSEIGEFLKGGAPSIGELIEEGKLTYSDVIETGAEGRCFKWC